MEKLTKWSYSTYNLWKQCPWKFKLLKLDGIPQESAPALERGIKYHQICEDYLKGKIKKVPNELGKLTLDFIDLRDDYENHAEEEWAFTRRMKVCGWDSDKAWLRLKIDNYVLNGDAALVIDFKTGKVRYGYENQLELYAWCVFERMKDINKVITELWYLDQGVIIGGKDACQFVFHRDRDYEEIKKKWFARAGKMFNDKTFEQKESFLCNYCQFDQTKHCSKRG